MAKKPHKEKQDIARLRGPTARVFRYECRQRFAELPGADGLLRNESHTDTTGLPTEPERVG